MYEIIIDLTAGNRHIYGGKTIPDELKDPTDTIIFCDIERNLRIPPNIICDNTHLPIRDKTVHKIVYDPPQWNFGTSIHGDPQEKRGSGNRSWRASYWGNFKNVKTLFRLFVGGTRESSRVLKENGMLYLKWCDAIVPLRRIIQVFSNFAEIGRKEWPSRSGRSTTRTYWIWFRLRSSAP